MSSWSRFGSLGQRGHTNSVLPIHSDDVDVKYHSKPSPSPPPPRRRSSTQQPLGLQRWIWLLLLFNVVVVIAFIFSSAFYFPPVVSDNVIMRQALSQGDRDFRGDLEPPTTQATATVAMAVPVHEPEPTAANTDTRSNADALTATLEVTADTAMENQSQQTQALVTEFPVSSAAAKSESESKQPAPGLASDRPVTLASAPQDAAQGVTDPSAALTETLAPVGHEATNTISAATELQPTLQHPIAVDSEPTQALNSNLAILLAKLKDKALRGATDNSPTAGGDRASEPSLAPVTTRTERGADTDDSVRARVPSTVAQPKTNEDALRTNLLVWLRADRGVEMDDEAECRATGTGTSCDVKAWTSQVAAPTPDVFTPATRDQPRPTFVASIRNSRALPALFFSCPLVNARLQLHAYMTLLFVLSPAQIETRGNPFKAQKFFGNAPYGQFFLRGGRPGFLSSGGVRELDMAASSGAFYLVTYRLRGDSVELKMNRQHWSRGVAPDPGIISIGADAFKVRMSTNAALSLGNVKATCDTNAFQGRIAEVMVYDTVLSDDRVDAVESYLERKWWDKPFPPPLAVATTTNAELTVEPATPREVETIDQVQTTDQVERDTTEPTADDTIPVSDPTPGGVMKQPTLTLGDQTSDGGKREREREQAVESHTFNPEDVFEWTPPETLLAQHSGARARVGEWTQHVREAVESIRSFSLGGEVLRAFIRSRKDELLALRQELFG